MTAAAPPIEVVRCYSSTGEGQSGRHDDVTWLARVRNPNYDCGSRNVNRSTALGRSAAPAAPFRLPGRKQGQEQQQVESQGERRRVNVGAR